MKTPYIILCVAACVLVAFGMACRFQEAESRSFFSGLHNFISNMSKGLIVLSVAVFLAGIGYSIASAIEYINR